MRNDHALQVAHRADASESVFWNHSINNPRRHHRRHCSVEAKTEAVYTGSPPPSK